MRRSLGSVNGGDDAVTKQIFPLVSGQLLLMRMLTVGYVEALSETDGPAVPGSPPFGSM